MKKRLAVVTFAAFAFAAYPAAACDWNREASTQNPVVAATDQTPQATPTTPQPADVASEESVRKPVDGTAPTVVADCSSGNCNSR